MSDIYQLSFTLDNDKRSDQVLWWNFTAKMFVVPKCEGSTQTVVSDNQLSDHRASLIYLKWAVTCSLSYMQHYSTHVELVQIHCWS